MMMDAVFFDSAHPIWKQKYPAKEMMKMGRRPITSDSGPQRSGPLLSKRKG